MTGRQLFDVLENADGIGHVPEGKINIKCARVDLALHFRMLEQRFQLRTKNEAAGARDRVIQRLLADAIAGNEELLIVVVPDRKRKHSAQLIEARRAELFVRMNDRFRVGVSSEAMTARL